MADGQTVRIGGRLLRVSHLDKVMYPATGTTKADVLTYLQEVAPAMLPHVRDRPVTRKRWVHGVGTETEPQEAFFAKGLEQGAPDWLERRTIQHSEGAKDYPLVQDAATLAWLGQMAAIELHTPQWRFGVDGELPPDRLVLDLDPGEGAGLAECQRVALLARELLEEIGLRPLPVTSGGKGLHLYAALDGSMSSDQASALAKAMATSLEDLHPDLVVSAQRKTLRVGKVLVDWSQNNGRKTTIAPYSLRGRAHPTVAAPRTWDEVEGAAMRQLEWQEVLERVGRDGDLLAALTPGPTSDRLESYRAKRRAGSTPEPVPQSPPPATYGQSFVIHEHHASRLHWDLRLEHEGVLESWAIPKGIPTSTERDHLAVRTEDHPLEYAEFEGTIPAGEYGAGTMRIWDAGTYAVKDWEDRLVVVTLSGAHDGGLGGEPTRVALVRTDGDQWLCHRMRLPAPRPPTSVERGSLAPMLASSRSIADVDPTDWVFEPKWDGWRALVTLDGDEVHVRSRSGRSLDDAFAELLDDIRAAVRVDAAILDGELVAGDGGGDLAALQGRLGVGRSARDDSPEAVTLVLFDVLEVDGRSFLDAPLVERRRALERIVDEGEHVELTRQLHGSPRALVAASARLGIEGLIAKRLGSRYRTGSRSDDWRKVVHVRTHEVAIVGWLPGTGSSRALGSLVTAAPDAEGALRYVGRVASGLTADERTMLAERLEADAPIELPGLPDDVARSMRWVRPVVAEVRFSAVTEAGALRQPVWRGVRDDKELSELEPLPMAGRVP